METDQRFAEAMKRIDAANAEDPRTEIVDGTPRPRELLFAQRVYDWVERLVAAPSEELLLAARAHTIRRWAIPRDRYPKTTVGYHEWRGALARFHAEQTESILRDVGYSDDVVQRVKAFISRANWPIDPEALALEDADCLVFLETKFRDYLDDWDEEKTLRILTGTIRKMTPTARDRAKQLKLDSRAADLLTRAMSTLKTDR